MPQQIGITRDDKKEENTEQGDRSAKLLSQKNVEEHCIDEEEHCRQELIETQQFNTGESQRSQKKVISHDQVRMECWPKIIRVLMPKSLGLHNGCGHCQVTPFISMEGIR